MDDWLESGGAGLSKKELSIVTLLGDFRLIIVALSISNDLSEPCILIEGAPIMSQESVVVLSDLPITLKSRRVL